MYLSKKNRFILKFSHSELIVLDFNAGFYRVFALFIGTAANKVNMRYNPALHLKL